MPLITVDGFRQDAFANPVVQILRGPGVAVLSAENDPHQVVRTGLQIPRVHLRTDLVVRLSK